MFFFFNTIVLKYIPIKKVRVNCAPAIVAEILRSGWPTIC